MLISILKNTKLFPAQLCHKVALVVFLFDPSFMIHCLEIDILIRHLLKRQQDKTQLRYSSDEVQVLEVLFTKLCRNLCSNTH